MQETIDGLKAMLKTVNLHNAAEQIEELLNVALIGPYLMRSF
jgi:hypothetical protein